MTPLWNISISNNCLQLLQQLLGYLLAQPSIYPALHEGRFQGLILGLFPQILSLICYRIGHFPEVPVKLSLSNTVMWIFCWVLSQGHLFDDTKDNVSSLVTTLFISAGSVWADVALIVLCMYRPLYSIRFCGIYGEKHLLFLWCNPLSRGFKPHKESTVIITIKWYPSKYGLILSIVHTMAEHSFPVVEDAI